MPCRATQPATLCSPPHKSGRSFIELSRDAIPHGHAAGSGRQAGSLPGRVLAAVLLLLLAPVLLLAAALLVLGSAGPAAALFGLAAAFVF